MSTKYPYKLTYEDLAVIYRTSKICGYLRNVHLHKSKLEGLCALDLEHCEDGKKHCYECEIYKRKIKELDKRDQEN